MADGEADLLDFSDLGGRRVEEADEVQPSGGFFGKFADLGAISVQNHPEWVEGWPLSADSSVQPQNATRQMPPKRTAAPIKPSQPPDQQARPFDFRDLGGQRVNFAPTEPSQPDKPGFSQRWAEGMNIPVTQEQEDAMREEMNPKWYDLVAPGWGRGLKMVGGMVKNAWEQQKEAAQDTVEALENVEKGEEVLPNLERAAVSKVEHDIKSAPGGEQLWNFGQDVHEGNWRGAAGGATAAFLQAALADALFGEGPSAPKAASTPTPPGPPTIPAEETVPTSRPVADTPRQPSGRYQDEVAPASTTWLRQEPAARVELSTRSAAHDAGGSPGRETFFKAHPELRGKVWVHHAIPLKAARLYPDALAKINIHDLEHLRGIPNEVNPELHLSKINREWNEFYWRNPNATEAQIRAKVAEIDAKYGVRFLPPKKR